MVQKKAQREIEDSPLANDPRWKMVSGTLPRKTYSHGDGIPQDIFMRVDEEGRVYQETDTTPNGIKVRTGWYFKCISTRTNTNILVHEEDLDIDVSEIVESNQEKASKVITADKTDHEDPPMPVLKPQYRDDLKEASLKNPAGVTILARAVGCSVLTARKHLNRLVEDGEIQSWKGRLGKVYGDPDQVQSEEGVKQAVNEMSKPTDVRKHQKLVAQGRLNGKRVRRRVRVLRRTKDRQKIQVETSDGSKMVMVWSDKSGGYVAEFEGGRLIARP